eukprot:g6792.t1
MGCTVPAKAAYLAAQRADVSALQVLLKREQHADYARVRELLEYRGAHGLTPLLVACQSPAPSQALGAVEKVLEGGADVTQVDQHLNNALHIVLRDKRKHSAAEAEAKAALVRLLLERGCPTGEECEAQGGDRAGTEGQVRASLQQQRGRNVEGLTPLEAARLRKGSAGASLAPALRALEQHLSLSSGWVHELTDNFVSRSLGRIAGLGGGELGGVREKLCTWQRRFYCVLPAPPAPPCPGAAPVGGALELRLYANASAA